MAKVGTGCPASHARDAKENRPSMAVVLFTKLLIETSGHEGDQLQFNIDLTAFSRLTPFFLLASIYFLNSIFEIVQSCIAMIIC